jgi:hypothetical protein
MSFENPLWVRRTSKGELLKLGFEAAPVASPEIYNTEDEVDRRKHGGLSWQSRRGSNRY